MDLQELKIKSNVITRSPFFNEIMVKYDQVGTSMSRKQFFEQYVSKMDPNLRYRSWEEFMKKYDKIVQIKAQKLLDKIADKEVSSMQMEEDSLRKILAIADLTLDQVVENPALLTNVPVTERMNWLFRAMSARDSRMLVVAKVQAEKRKTSMYEDMFQGAQYGDIEAEEIADKSELKSEKKDN